MAEPDKNMLDEYDFSASVRGKYAGQFVQGTNLVRLDDDVARIFPDSASVNRALRTLAEAARRTAAAHARPTGE